MDATNNNKLMRLAEVWVLDGDLMRCRECGRALIASRDGQPLRHKMDCSRSSEEHPWQLLRDALGE